MKQTHLIKRILAVSLGIIFMQSGLSAQAYKIELDKPEIEKLPSPDLGGSIGNKSFKPKDWMEIEVKFKVIVPPKDADKIKFVDKVTVKWYVATKTPDGGRQLILLEKEVNHVNVPVGEDVFTSIYLSPSAIMRLTGSDRVSKGDVENVGGEIRVNGSEAYGKSGFFTMKSKPMWWNSGKLSRYDKIPVRNKNETPFKNLWYDRYAEIEVEK